MVPGAIFIRSLSSTVVRYSSIMMPFYEKLCLRPLDHISDLGPSSEEMCLLLSFHCLTEQDASQKGSMAGLLQPYPK